MNGAAVCKFCLVSVKQYSEHDITLCNIGNLNEFDFDDFDIVHIHSHIQKKFFEIKKAKVIYGVHSFNLSCPMGGYVCSVLNRYLDEPLTCLNCLGYAGIVTGSNNMRTSVKMAQKADLITVHSEFMKEFYHTWNPVNLPLPLETDKLTQCDDKDDYLFYSGRLSFEKNPYGFVDIVNKTGMKAKMVLYNLNKEHVPGSSESHYQELFHLIKKNKNIELYMNPTLEEMFELVRHAKFTVLPYLFAEPFGIAVANSVLSGTPVITFPFGNARNMTKLLPQSKDETIKMIKMDDETYSCVAWETEKKGDEMRETHKPENAVKVWDKTYEDMFNQPY